MQYLGDYAEDYATLNFKFSTHKADGTPIALAGTPAVSVYKANGTTQSTAEITLSVDFDSVTGLNNVLIDLSADAFYAVGNDYSVVITAGTVDGVSVVGTVLAHFSIENRYELQTGDAYAVVNKALPDAVAGANGGLSTTNGTKLNQTADLTAGQKIAATLAAADVSGNLPAEVKAQDNIDFGALQKASIKIQAQDGLATVNDVQSGLATPTNITSASGISLSSDGIKAIWDFLTADATAAILSFANLFKTNIDAKVSEAGGGLDAAGVRAAVGLESANLDMQLEAILEDTGTTIPALISAGSGAGVGAISYPYTLTDADDENPISGAEVWVTTDSSGSNIVASGYTNLFGTVIFFLDAGTYYFWSKCSGYNFTNPDVEIVEE
jgi:hypothetical protein